MVCNLKVLFVGVVQSARFANLRFWQDGSWRSCGKLMGLVVDSCLV